MKRVLTVFAVTVVVLTASGLMLAQSNPLLGTWKLNVAKSTYVKVLPPKNETRTVEAQGAGTKYSLKGVTVDGSRIGYSYTTNYDGKDSPVSGVGQPNGYNTIAIKRVDASTTTATAKKDGKVVQTWRTVLSKDGKVATITSKGTNAQGQPTSATSVWEKQ